MQRKRGVVDGQDDEYRITFWSKNYRDILSFRKLAHHLFADQKYDF